MGGGCGVNSIKVVTLAELIFRGYQLSNVIWGQIFD